MFLKHLYLLATLSVLSVGIYLTGQILSQTYVIEAPVLAESGRVASVSISKNVLPLQYDLPEIVSTTVPATSNYVYTWEQVDTSSPDTQQYLTMLDVELEKYDKEFFDKTGVNNIYVVSNIVSRQGYGSLGFTETVSGDIYLNITNSDRVNNGDVVSTIHHEIGHMITIAGLGMSGLYSDEWQHLNSTQTIYGSTNGDVVSDIFPEDGFVSAYAKTSIAEDMAEVFAFSMSDEYRLQLSINLIEDEVLRNKVDFIAEVIGEIGLDVPWKPLLPQFVVSVE